MWRTKYSFLGYFEKPCGCIRICSPDWVARLGMRVGGEPIKGDTPITTGESGARFH